MASSYSTLSSKGSERLTLEQIKRKRALADALMSKGFPQTAVAPGGQYSTFAGLADAIRSVTGNLQGSRQNKALDAREAELAAIEQGKQDTHANLFNRPQGQPTLVEPEQPLGRGPAPLPDELAAPEPVTQPVTPAPGPEAIAPLPVAPTANPMHQELAGALMQAVPELGQSKGPQTFPLSNTPSPQGEGFQSIRQADPVTPAPVPGPQAFPVSDTPSAQGEGFQAVAEAMRGMPAPGTIPPPFSQSQQDQIGDIEASSMLGDNPDYPPEIMPPGPPIEIGPDGVGTMSPMTVTGRRPQEALLEALKAQPPSAPTGPAPPPELVQALMQKSGLAMPPPMAQAPPTAPTARPAAPAQPQAAADDRWIRLWKSSVAMGDKDGMKFALERMSPENKLYVIKGSLVDSMGKVIHRELPGSEGPEKFAPGSYSRNADGSTEYHPKLADNMEYIDPNNRALGTRSIPNAAEINARTRGMETGAETQAKSEVESQFKLIPVPDGQGGTTLMTEAQYLKTQKGNTPAATTAPNTIDYTDSKGTRIEFQGSLDELRQAADSTGRGDYKAAVNEYEQSLKGGGAAASGGLGQTPSPQQKEYSVSRAKEFSESMANVNSGAVKARGMMTKLGALEKYYRDPGVVSGKLAGTISWMKGLADSFGIDIKGKKSEDVIEAVTNSMALELRNTGEGGGMPGAMSDADRNYLVNMTPNLSKTAEGRNELIKVYKSMHQRTIDVQRQAMAYERKHGQLDDGFQEELSRWSAANPLFEQSPAPAGGKPDIKSFWR
jgi:hypothetical protein